MARQPSSTPTEVELEILQVLWTRGPSTVRQVFNILKDARGTQYSTTLKMVQVMTDKGLLRRDSSVRPQVYSTAQTQEQTQLRLVDNLMQKGFGGSARNLVLRAAAAERITSRDLTQIKRLIDQARTEGDEGVPPSCDAGVSPARRETVSASRPSAAKMAARHAGGTPATHSPAKGKRA